MGKAFVILLVIFMLSLMAVSAVYVLPVKAQSQIPTTTISDYGINPSSAPIQQVGNTYTLTSEIDGILSVKKNNIILDGDGNTLGGGLLLNDASNVTVKNFNIQSGEQFGEISNGVFTGIYLSDTSNSTIANNKITEISNFVLVFVNYETVAGIIVTGGTSNTISRNNFVNNWQGIVFSNTANNHVVENNIISSNPLGGHADVGGIYFDHSSNNIVYHNNFNIDLGAQAKDSYYNSTNTWDNGYPSGGNYWSNYQSLFPNAKEVNSSGIGNTAYVIDAQNNDSYPLMNPFNSAFEAQQSTPPQISLSSPMNQTYKESNVTLTFSIDVSAPVKSVYWTGYSLDGKQNITLTGNSTLNKLSSGQHYIIVYANDSYGNMGASENVTFTISSPYPIVTVAVSGGIVVIVVVAGLLVYFKKHKR